MSKILFCDDDALMQKIAGKFLGDAGSIFPGGQELFDRHKGDPSGTKYCIVDLNMPDPDGYATLELIRKFDKSNGRVTRVIALSGDADEDACQAKVKECGFDGLVGKPLNKNKLAALD
jgi:CheY-like chemotaxis protein